MTKDKKFKKESFFSNSTKSFRISLSRNLVLFWILQWHERKEVFGRMEKL